MDLKGQNKKLIWQKGIELTFSISGWLVGPLVAALFLGKYLDQKFNSKPWLFLISCSIAFIITIIGMIYGIKKFIKQQLKNNQNEPGRK